jgi:hypothetical protein
MRYSSRLFLYAPLFVLLALAVAAGLRWFAVKDGMESWLRDHNGREIAPGVTMRFGAESVTGFPFNLDVVLRDVAFEVKSARTSGAWRMDAFAIHELTFGRTQQIYEAAGAQTITWADAEGGRHRFAFVPGSLQASAILSRGRLARFDLDLNEIGARDIAGVRFQLHFRKAPDRDAIEIVASGDQIRLAPPLQAGFGKNLRRAQLSASLTPGNLLAPLFAGSESWDAALDAWRRGGGTFHLGDMELDFGGVQIHASGALGLDAAHRPQGTIALAIDGASQASIGGTGAGRLARAIQQLTKVTNTPPRALSLNIDSGDVNLRVTKSPQPAAGAGSLGPLY